MAETSLIIRLSAEDWNKSVGGWRCPILDLPGGKVKELFINGAIVDKKFYDTQTKGHVRYSGSDDRDANVSVELDEVLARRSRLKTLAIVLPVAGTIAGAAIKAAGDYIVERAKTPSPASAEGKPVIGQVAPQGAKFVVIRGSEKEKPNQSQLVLQFDKNRVSGDGSAGNKSWVYSGYSNGGYVVLADRSASEDSSTIGLGVHILQSVDGDRNSFVGYWRGMWCNDDTGEREIRQCPVVVVQGEPDGFAVKGAIERYKDFLTPRSCIVTPLVPRPTPAVACAGTPDPVRRTSAAAPAR